MFLSQRSHLLHPYSRLPLVSVLLVAICATTARAQMGGIDPDPGDPGTGGKNTLQGSIYLPNGRRLDRRVKVKLISLFGGERFLLSDDTGAFSFRRLQGGRYTVSVDAGTEFEVAAESVDIVDGARRRADPGITISVHITLKPKRSDTKSIVGTIDASIGVPEAARELYKEAVELAKAGNRKKAIELLNKALEIFPSFMPALNELGTHYMAAKQWEKAAESLRSALKISPDSFQPRLNYGITLLQMKKHAEAAVELQRAVEKDGTSTGAHLNLGRALVNLGDYRTAEKSLRSCVNLGGEESVEAHRYLGAVYIETRNDSQAIAELETYVKLAPKAKDADRIRIIIKDLQNQTAAKR